MKFTSDRAVCPKCGHIGAVVRPLGSAHYIRQHKDDDGNPCGGRLHPISANVLLVGIPALQTALKAKGDAVVNAWDLFTTRSNDAQFEYECAIRPARDELDRITREAWKERCRKMTEIVAARGAAIADAEKAYKDEMDRYTEGIARGESRR